MTTPRNWAWSRWETSWSWRWSTSVGMSWMLYIPSIWSSLCPSVCLRGHIVAAARLEFVLMCVLILVCYCFTIGWYAFWYKSVTLNNCTRPHPPTPTPLQEPEQGRTGVRARRSTAHQDDAAALLRIRFMWTLHFGSYMILLPCGVINDDDIYRRPVVGLCILVYRDETSPVTKSAFLEFFAHEFST